MLTAEIFKAPAALQGGFVHHTGPLVDCEQFISAKLDTLRGNAPEATRIVKTLMRKIKTIKWEDARKLTVKTIAQRRVSKEGQEGMNAFFEKRPAAWRTGGKA
jgi:methylglutaconyl-CoA hydratase